jgi:DNA-binding SARP family transcriptional activator
MSVLLTNEGTFPSLQVRLLGHFALEHAGRVETGIDSPRLQALLAFLLLRRGAPASRQQLAFSFWPDSTDKQARTNLRHLLHRLRRVLPEADRFLRVDNTSLTWRREAPFTLDVAEFEQALAGAEEAIQHADWAAAQEALQRAAGTYRGDLLPDCYDAWIEPERDRLRQAQFRAIERLVRLLEDRRDYAAAIQYARQLLRQDPLREPVYETLMRLHALHGDRAGALRVYSEGVATLQRELGVAPGPAVQGLHATLKTMQHPAAVERSAEHPVPPDLLPLIGRQEAWEQLRATWRMAARGQAHLVVVTGEAGIGKTRLVAELVEWIARQGNATARTRSYAAEGRLTYAPVADWLRAEALRAVLPRLGPVWLAEVSRLLPELRAEHPELPEPQPVRESWQRLRMFEAFSRAVLASGAPLLLFLDDMQWADAETLAWLHYLLRFAPQARLLLAGTIRPEEMDAEPALATLLADVRREGLLTELALGPLGETETAELAAHLAGRPLHEDEALRLYRETQGHPLFVVETVRAGLLEESAAGWTLPPKVQAVIAARLAQLSPEASALAALAATIGRPFSLDVLAEASGEDERSLARAIDELWQRRLMLEHGTGEYDFSHDKLREVAYAQVSPARRRLMHRQVARALERVHAGDLDVISGRLAAHHEQAGQAAQAIPYYHRAGQLAKDMHADRDAIHLFRRALVLLGGQPGTTDRSEQELALQTALGACLVASEGHAAPEVRQVYERALSLCGWLGRSTAAPILRGLAIANLVAGDLHRAHALGDEILKLARDGQDPVLFVEGHYVLGVSSFWLGRFGPARQHLERAIHRYDPQQHRVHTTLFAQDPKVVCLCRLGRTLWYLGYPDRAVRRVEDSLALAQVLGHPFSRAYALLSSGQFYLELGDLRRAQECVDALLPLAAEQGFSMWESMGTVWRGALLAEQGELGAGIACMRQGITAYSETGGTTVLPQFHGFLARACLRGGRFEEGLSALTRGMELVERTDDRFYEAELLRLKGELLLAGGADAGEAERCFRAALDVARRQEARSLELGAAMSLGQLWHRRGETGAARRTLGEAYGWFSEGCGTPALREARRLLEAWASVEDR